MLSGCFVIRLKKAARHRIENPHSRSSTVVLIKSVANTSGYLVFTSHSSINNRINKVNGFLFPNIIKENSYNNYTTWGKVCELAHLKMTHENSNFSENLYLIN